LREHLANLVRATHLLRRSASPAQMVCVNQTYDVIEKAIAGLEQIAPALVTAINDGPASDLDNDTAASDAAGQADVGPDPAAADSGEDATPAPQIEPASDGSPAEPAAPRQDPEG